MKRWWESWRWYLIEFNWKWMAIMIKSCTVDNIQKKSRIIREIYQQQRKKNESHNTINDNK